MGLSPFQEMIELSKYDAPCCVCGRILPGTAKSLPVGQRTCRRCRDDGLNPALRVVCVTCGETFSTPAANVRLAKYCGPACKPAKVPVQYTTPSKACHTCGAVFTAAWQRYCSDACLPTCAEPGCSKVVAKRGYCGAHYQRRCRPGRDHGSPDRGQEWRERNPEAYAKHLEDKNHRRRARSRQAEAEKIDRQRVGDRDGWRCFCGKRIDQSLKHPDPMSQSLDHVQPISEGGAHTYANVRIAHLRCNTVRGNRGGNEQLALIGGVS